MTVRKPLVMVNGEIQQLQSSDSLADAALPQLIADAVIIAGAALYASAADHVNNAKADSIATARVVGLAAAAIGSGSSGSVETQDILALTTAQWDAVAGTTGGLTFNTDYYLSAATAGMLTATPPSTVGQVVVKVGRAISTTELKVQISQPILL